MEEALDLLRRKDTNDRIAGLHHLHQLLGAYSKPLSSSQVNSLVDACLDLLKHDNFRVSQGALQVLASAAVIARDFLTIHFTSLLPAAVERLGDANQPVRDAARALLLTLMEISSPTIIVERAGSYAWEHKNWRIREEFARTVTSAINLCSSTELPLQRAIMPHILHMLNDPNHAVREAATACIEAKDINARLERIEPNVCCSYDGSELGAVPEHKLANFNRKRSRYKHRSSSHETSLSGGLQLNDYQLNGGAYSCEKSVTGCLERVADLFDIKSGVPRNKLLTENGSNVSRSLSEVSTMSHSTAKGSGDKSVAQDLKCRCDYPKLIGVDAPSHEDTYRTKYMRNLSHENGSCSTEQKMVLIRQKFKDAKCLSTNEKLRKTKEFKDALDVLSSNQHLFLKVLQEPNSSISHPLPTQLKRITVLKPSKMVYNEKLLKKSKPQNCFGHSPVVSTRRSEPTRIVVLKPTPGMMQDITSRVNVEEARKVAKVITQQMRENLDETALSSVLSYGYTGDESSYTKSEAEFVGDFSDSEVTSPAFKHSWDYINRNGGCYSSSLLTRAESPVAREAKKRLSERWASNVEQRRDLKSQSTLGEMLALSEICEVDNAKSDEVHRVSTSCLISNTRGLMVESPGSLLRSKSLPDTENKMDGSTKQAAKSSFKGKVTSLFFQRTKKPCKGKIDNAEAPSDINSPNQTLWLDLNEEPSLASQQATWSTLKSGENQEQPSPSSVLDASFEEDELNTIGRSNLIDKSRPIGSIARTLSCDEPEGCNEGEWLFLVQSLLSLADVENLAKWHSPNTPLSPSLREKYVNLIAKQPLNRRQLRSKCWLVFDSVNAALLDVLADRVWERVKDGFLSNDWVEGEGGVERVVRKELVGGGWEDRLRSEIEIVGEEIEGKLMEELVEESVAEWIDIKLGRYDLTFFERWNRLLLF